MKREYGQSYNVTHNTTRPGWLPFFILVEHTQQMRHDMLAHDIDPMTADVQMRVDVFEGRVYTSLVWRALKEVPDEPAGAVQPEVGEAEEAGRG